MQCLNLTHDQCHNFHNQLQFHNLVVLLFFLSLSLSESLLQCKVCTCAIHGLGIMSLISSLSLSVGFACNSPPSLTCNRLCFPALLWHQGHHMPSNEMLLDCPACLPPFQLVLLYTDSPFQLASSACSILVLSISAIYKYNLSGLVEDQANRPVFPLSVLFICL
jgi:hypothetical protein